MAEHVLSFLRLDEELTKSSDVPFKQHVMNLVAIDNANMPIEDANIPRGNQLLMKALVESIRVAKVSASRTKKLEDRSDRVKPPLLQAMGFYIIFQGAVLTITVAAVQKAFVLEGWHRWIPLILSSSAGLGLVVASTKLGSAITKLRMKRFEEERRRLVFEHNELQLQRHGASFDFETHGRNYTPEEISIRTLYVYIRHAYFWVLVAIYGFLILIIVFEFQIMFPRGSTSAGGAPFPAPSLPVQSGTPGKTWCVAKAGSPDTDVMNGLSFACGEGVRIAGQFRQEAFASILIQSSRMLPSHTTRIIRRWGGMSGAAPSEEPASSPSRIQVTPDAVFFEKGDMSKGSAQKKKRCRHEFLFELQGRT